MLKTIYVCTVTHKSGESRTFNFETETKMRKFAKDVTTQCPEFAVEIAAMLGVKTPAPNWRNN